MFKLKSEETVKAKTLPTLRVLLNDNSLRFYDLHPERNKVFLELASDIKYYAETNRRQIQVVPLCQTPLYAYWLSLSISLTSQRGAFLFNGISLSVFFGKDVDPNKTPLFRAEWDVIDQPRHAQPHWHYFLHPKKEREVFLAKPRTETFKPSRLDFGLPENKYYRFERMHFTMLADWHKEADSNHSQVVSNKNINNWIKSCVLYIRDQIIFADE